MTTTKRRHDMKRINLWAIIAFIASILSIAFVYKLIVAGALIIIGLFLGAVAIAQIIRHEENGLFLAVLSIIFSLVTLGLGIFLLVSHKISISNLL